MNDEAAYFEDVKCIRETAGALLVLVDEQEVWVPKSLVGKLSEVSKKGDEGVLILPQWWAEQKELV